MPLTQAVHLAHVVLDALTTINTNGYWPVDTCNNLACSDLGGLRAATSWCGTVSDRIAWRQLMTPVLT